jgi:(E)-4-hydroxy-3-methylbut-2-enyl-diphosphate synthase
MGSKKHIIVGGVQVGGGAPIRLQSMTNTVTSDVKKTVEQINRLSSLGCEIIRVAAPDIASAEAISEIKSLINIPLVADIHFDHKLAIRAVEAGADKIRINPGNFGAEDYVKAVTSICKQKNIPIRIGVNSGSVDSKILAKYGRVCAEAVCESALEYVRLLNKFDFDDICLSVKCSSVSMTISAYKMLSERTGHPLHLGVTEAGTEYMGIIKSSIGIGTLLAAGIGDTIRVSLTEQPEKEVLAGSAILRALDLRDGYELISCPTCGRCKIDLIPLAHETERRLELLGKNISVAVMGCAVNGPGEASQADYGIAGGDGEGILFMKGQIVGKAPMEKLIDELFTLIENGSPLENSTAKRRKETH